MERLQHGAVPALGRVMMAFIFLAGGWGKLMAPGATVAYIGNHGLPLPEAAYCVALGVELGGGALILLGYQTRAVALAMAVWCLVTGALFHYVPDDRNMMIHLFKNIAMAGGFLQLAAWGAGTWSLDAMLRRRTVRLLEARA